jgi:hypothetical protein
VTAAAFILLALANINVCGCDISFFFVAMKEGKKLSLLTSLSYFFQCEQYE